MLKMSKKKIGKIGMAIIALSMLLCFVPKPGRVAASAGTSLTAQTDRIVKKKTKPSDSAKKKLKKLFKYAEKTYGYKRATGFRAYSGWEKDCALEMFKEKNGSCYHFAAAYAFLAKKATGYEVRIGIGKTNGFSGQLQSHAWTEIKINSKWYICDTNMDKFAENSSLKYFLKKRSKLNKVYDNFKNVQYYSAVL